MTHQSLKHGVLQVIDSDSSEDEAAVFVPSTTWLQHSLTQRLGEWEKHTKVSTHYTDSIIGNLMLAIKS